MIKAVLDTNILVSASLYPKGNVSDRVVRAWLNRRYHLITSPALVNEYQRVLLRERIRAISRLSLVEVLELLMLIEHTAEITVPGELSIKVSRDESDNKFLVAAVEGNADYLISGDDDLRVLGLIEQVRIISPSEFLRRNP